MAVPTSPTPARDPRDVITPDALHVAPELLGLPLARPWRRLAAVSIDGLLIAILANAPSVLFGIAGALLLLRISSRPAAGGGYMRSSARLMLRFSAAVILFVVVTGGASKSLEWAKRRTTRAASEMGTGVLDARAEAGKGPSGVLEGARALAETAALMRAQTEAEARTRAGRLVDRFRELGMEEKEIREAVRGIASEQAERGKPWMVAAADSALRALSGEDGEQQPARPSADSLVSLYAAALAAGDSARAAELRGPVVAVLARDSLDRLHAQAQELREERSRLRSQVAALREKAAEGPGIMAALRGLVEDLGLGFGWGGLYFTAMAALWRGQTPGKRLLGIRVVRLNGKPIGWWIAFERFGGYAAGVATGLLGFLQVYWDHNRQAIHDKIAETAVIRD